MSKAKKNTNNWLERLKYYTSDFTKNEAIQLVNYVRWKKCEIEIEKADKIKEDIKNNFKP